MTERQEFGKRIQELREAKKKDDPAFSLRKFGLAVDLSPTFLSKLENGEMNPPKAEKIKKMAELLEVDADELLALAGKVSPDLPEIIQETPIAMADLLRTVQGLSEKELKEITARIKKGKKE